MGKINQLHAEGVTDLHSYNVGVADGRKAQNDETIEMIQRALDNPSLDLTLMPTRMAITVLLAAIKWTDEE